MNNFTVNASYFIFKNDNDIRDEYRIGKQVGERGSYGYIRFCIHRKMGCLRAVKIIDKTDQELLEIKGDTNRAVIENKEI